MVVLKVVPIFLACERGLDYVSSKAKLGLRLLWIIL